METTFLFKGKDQAEQNSFISPSIQKNYIQDGNNYYQKSNPEVIAFIDKPNGIDVLVDSKQVARDLVHTAKKRGAVELTIKGTGEAASAAWLEANLQGMTVKGFMPTDQENALLLKEKAAAEALASQKIPIAQKKKLTLIWYFKGTPVYTVDGLPPLVIIEFLETANEEVEGIKKKNSDNPIKLKTALLDHLQKTAERFKAILSTQDSDTQRGISI